MSEPQPPQESWKHRNRLAYWLTALCSLGAGYIVAVSPDLHGAALEGALWLLGFTFSTYLGGSALSHFFDRRKP